MDVDRFLDNLLRQGLVQTVKSLATYKAILLVPRDPPRLTLETKQIGSAQSSPRTGYFPTVSRAGAVGSVHGEQREVESFPTLVSDDAELA
jgi:hypothetical protein